MVNLPFEIIKLIRPIHWVKNFALFAALIFSGLLTQPGYLTPVIWAFIIFNMAASATYVFNDLLDAEKDARHPIKKNRPIAKGVVPKELALFISAVLATSSLTLANQLSHLFFLIVLGYLLLQVGYSLFLKNLPIIDILIIASGFVIRVYAGAVIINAHLSVWFLLCVISVALFLASGKRRAELGTVGKDALTRSSLKKYSIELLNSYVTMFANAAWLSWSLFTFFESPETAQPFWLLLAELSRTTTVDKLLMATIPVTIFAIMRYQSLIFEDRSEAPESILLKDKWLVSSVGLWGLMVIWILYGGISVGTL